MKKVQIRCLFNLLMVTLVTCSCNNSSSVENESKSTSTELLYISPNEINVDTSILKDLTEKVKNQFYPNIHSILLAKDGMLFFEEYFTGTDANYGESIGVIQHNDTTLHDVRSITKSVVSACVGIAIKNGFIINVDQKIGAFFPEYEFEGDKTNWTIDHFLTMTTGMVWNENVPYDNPANDEIQMTYSKDPIRYVFSKPLEHKPGETFNYNGGATQVLAKIIERTAKISIDVFANEYLFEPLGIHKFEWNKYSKWNGADEFAAPSGLRLTSRNMMKIGLLYRNGGKLNNVQVLNQDWVVESFVQRIEFPSDVSDGNDGYGYQFWMWPDVIKDNEVKIIAAIGNGGQNIYWDMKHDITIVITAGNYNKWDIENNSYSVLRNHVYPSLGNIQ